MADVANLESLTTAASGSVGGVVFSRNQHGPYYRSRTVPLDPATARQIAVRNALFTLTARWRDTLTSAERLGWDVYAHAVPLLDRLGRRTNAGGLGMYVRSNVPRIQAAEVALPVVDPAPSRFDLASYTPFTRIVLNVIDDVIYVYFVRHDPWTFDAAAAMLFYVSPPQPLTVNFWKGPYRYADCLVGNTGDILNTPATIAIPFPAAQNQRVFVRLRVTRGDGRLSSSARLTADHLPQIPPVPTMAKYYPPPLHACTTVFDRRLTPGALNAWNWSARIANQVYGATWAYVSATHEVRANLSSMPFPSPGLNTVFYAPPPFDVTAYHTSVPAAAFSFPIP